MNVLLATGSLLGSIIFGFSALRHVAFSKQCEALAGAANARFSASEAAALSSGDPRTALAAVSGFVGSSKRTRAMEGQEVALLKEDRTLGVNTFSTLECHELHLTGTAGSKSADALASSERNVSVDVKALRRVVEEPGYGLPVLYGLHMGGVSAVHAKAGLPLLPSSAYPTLKRRQALLPLGALATVVGRLVIHETGRVEITAHPRLGIFLLGSGASLIDTLAALRAISRRWKITALSAGALSIACCIGLAAPEAVVGAWDMLCYWGTCAGAKVGLWDAPPTAPTIRWPGSRPGTRAAVDGPGADGGGITECIACIERGANCALMPCGHVCLCIRCAGRLRFSAPSSGRRCPICRAGITDLQRIYIAGEILPEHQPAAAPPRRRRDRSRSRSSSNASGSSSGGSTDRDESGDEAEHRLDRSDADAGDGEDAPAALVGANAAPAEEA